MRAKRRKPRRRNTAASPGSRTSYHQACDTLKDALQSAEVDQVEAAYGDAVIVGNVNTKALDEMSDAAAHATLTSPRRPRRSTAPTRPPAVASKMEYEGPMAIK